MTSEDLRRQTERSHLDLDEFQKRMKKLGRGEGRVVHQSNEHSGRPCPPRGGGSEHGTPQGQNRQTEPHRVNMTVTAAGISLASSQCCVLVKMPGPWVWWECFFFFGKTVGG